MKYDKKIVVKFFAEHEIYAVPEYPFHKTRKWRFDFILSGLNPNNGHPSLILARSLHIDKLALEVDGGLFIAGGGRHNRGASMLKDFEKLNEAAALGWRIIRVTPDQLCMESTIELIKRALNVR